MGKIYTNEEVLQRINKKTDQVAKDGETYEYELSLTHDADQGFIVDCREDIVKNGDVLSSEYSEGFIFDNYSEAEKKLKEIEDRLEKQNQKIFITNEVKTLHNVLGRDIESMQKKKYYIGVSILNCYEVEANNKEQAEDIVRNYSNKELLDDCDFNINYIDEIKE